MDGVNDARTAQRAKSRQKARPSKFIPVLLCSIVVLAVSAVLALWTGPIPLTFPTIIHILSTHYDANSASSSATIVWEVRLPRIALAVLVGLALGASGVAFQSLLRNDLAEPYILGISSGASVAAALVGLLTVSAAYVQILEPAAAFVGAGVVLFIVMGISYSYGRIDTRSLLLSGVVVSAFLWAVEMAALRIAGKSFEEILNWLMGSLANATWSNVQVLTAVVPISVLVLIYLSPSMNLYSVGEDSAKQLGLEVEQFKWILIITATLLAASAVSIVGIIGFIGLIAPHIARKVLRTPDHRQIMPIAALGGAILMLWSDTVARVLLSGDILPVGIITAFLGAPFFVYKLKTEKVR